MNQGLEFTVSVEWRGDVRRAANPRRPYDRETRITSVGKRHPLEVSAAAPFFGDAQLWNPEELLLAALAQCHLLSYLFVAQQRGIDVLAYTDSPVATLVTDPGGSGRITAATLRPIVTIPVGADAAHARDAHTEASQLCFIARSVAFDVRLDPRIVHAGE